MHRARLLTTAAVLVTLVLSGCGGSEDSTTDARTTDTVAVPDRPVDALAQGIAACLEERGWDVVASWDGAVENAGPIPSEQMNQYQADYEECRTTGLANQPPVTDDDKRDRYQAQIEERACLVGEGFALEDPPTLQTYLDTFGTEGEYYATLDLETGGMDQDQLRALFEKCPPPEWYS